MILRELQHIIVESLKNFPVVGIIGSRQVGKTTLAKSIKQQHSQNAIYIDLELPSDLNKLQDPELYLSQFNDVLVIIDEIQRMPSLFPLIRALVDQKRTNGRFLILGSASPSLIKQSSESLAGRIQYHELTPFYLKEIGYDKKNMKNLWLKGGYPNSFLSNTDELSFQWRESFIKTYLERDIPQLGIHIPANQLHRFWTMLAHTHGQLWNASKIANSLGVSSPTVKKYLDILEQTFIIKQLLPYHANIKKRLVKSQKIYIRDSGLLHTLLNIKTFDDLNSHPALGNSWEGFVTEQINSLIPDSWQTFFIRTSAVAEIDLLIIDHHNNKIAIEIKYSISPKISKGFWHAYKDLSCHKGYIIYPGKESYPINNNVTVLPLQNTGEIISL